jgi:ketosteroid isomerase-like protein
MGTPAQNVAILKDAYRQWHESKGGSVQVWLDLMTDDVKVRSLAAGRPSASFTVAADSKEQFKRYFEGLLADWEMINYKTGTFIAEGDRVAMLGSTSWRHRKTGRVVDTPKADFWTFREGKIADFRELYDTAALLDAGRP